MVDHPIGLLVAHYSKQSSILIHVQRNSRRREETPEIGSEHFGLQQVELDIRASRKMFLHPSSKGKLPTRDHVSILHPPSTAGSARHGH